MKTFIISALVIGFLFGLVFDLIVGITLKDISFKLKIAIFVIAPIVFGVVGGGLYSFSFNHDIQEWNNGYCECGGEFKLKDIESYNKNRIVYFYECEDCENVIQVNNNMK